ncbi:hypothetical protein BV20DRAFT_436919 [Pilatotrama ljubarskyi]|nr:hypothetical protein BV20DRAFT_436919 [Pilatotrama ljubarskyi]
MYIRQSRSPTGTSSPLCDRMHSTQRPLGPASLPTGPFVTRNYFEPDAAQHRVFGSQFSPRSKRGRPRLPPGPPDYEVRTDVHRPPFSDSTQDTNPLLSWRGRQSAHRLPQRCFGRCSYSCTHRYYRRSAAALRSARSTPDRCVIIAAGGLSMFPRAAGRVRGFSYSPGRNAQRAGSHCVAWRPMQCMGSGHCTSPEVVQHLEEDATSSPRSAKPCSGFVQ